MQTNTFSLSVVTANVQFAPYCYLRPDTKQYIGLSEAGKLSVMDIMSRIKSKTITPEEGTAEGKRNIMEGKTLEYTDWSSRSIPAWKMR